MLKWLLGLFTANAQLKAKLMFSEESRRRLVEECRAWRNSARCGEIVTSDCMKYPISEEQQAAQRRRKRAITMVNLGGDLRKEAGDA